MVVSLMVMTESNQGNLMKSEIVVKNMTTLNTWSSRDIRSPAGFSCCSQFKSVLLDVKCNPRSVNLPCTTRRYVHVCSYMYTGVFLPNTKDSVCISKPHSDGSKGGRE
jgi:hypothetical protein